MFNKEYNKKMNFAMICLSNNHKNLSSIQYEASIRIRKLRGATTLGRNHTEETKLKIKETKALRKLMCIKNKRNPHTEKTKEHMRKPKPERCKGKLSPEEYKKRNYKNRNTRPTGGKPLTKEQKIKAIVNKRLKKIEKDINKINTIEEKQNG